MRKELEADPDSFSRQMAIRSFESHMRGDLGMQFDVERGWFWGGRAMNNDEIVEAVALHLQDFLRELLAVQVDDEESTDAILSIRRRLEGGAKPEDVPYLFETLQARLEIGRLRREKDEIREKIAQGIEVARFAVGLVALL